MTPTLGAHVSISGGMYRSLERGFTIGANCIQIFTRNQMTWKVKLLKEMEIKKFREERKKYKLGTVMSHDSYLINLASPDPEKRKKSIDAFEEELVRCTLLGIDMINFHPGAHMGEGVEKGIRILTKALNGICERHPYSDVKLVLETVAGQGSTIGRSFEELALILAGLDQPERFGVCVDTAHIFAAGYDIATADGWAKTWEQFGRTLGMSRLSAFHVNDSKVPLGSNVDRHALIGRGEIGPGAFQRLMRDPRTRDRPMFLETPAGMDGYAREIAWLSAAARGEDVPLPEIKEQKGSY